MTERKGPMVRVGSFEGSIGELVQKAQAGEIDLREVRLAEMVQTYLATLRQPVDLEEVTEFLGAASALVELKSKNLLPSKPQPQEPVAVEEAEDLARRIEAQLEEYRVFREAAEALAQLEAVQRRVFTRLADEASGGELPLVGVTVEDLFTAFRRVLERSEPKTEEVPAEGVTVADRMRFVLQILQQAPRGLEFEALFEPGSTRLVVIVTFLALLELVRHRQIRVVQEQPFGPIRLYAGSPKP